MTQPVACMTAVCMMTLLWPRAVHAEKAAPQCSTTYDMHYDYETYSVYAHGGAPTDIPGWHTQAYSNVDTHADVIGGQSMDDHKYLWVFAWHDECS